MCIFGVWSCIVNKFSEVLGGVLAFGLDGERFYSEGFVWVGCWGLCGGPPCLLVTEFGFGNKKVLHVIWDDVCGVEKNGCYREN